MDLENQYNNDFWVNRSVFVTGCTGLLGSWLTKTLVDLGADVVGLVRDWVPQSELARSGTIERIKIVRGDVADAELVNRVFSEYEVRTCFHLAAQTIVGIANRMPIPTFETNIKGTWNVLEAGRQWSKTEQIILASSDKAYGDHEVLPYAEDAALQGRHPYDVSKSCADLLGLAYANTYDLPVAITRCGNMFGGGDLNWNRIVPGVMRWSLMGEQPIIRSDGSLRRDYVYVLDIVDAYLTLAEAMAGDNLAGEAFNFGLNEPLTVLEMAQSIIDISPNPDLDMIVQGEAPNEIQNQYLDSSKARRVLNWEPKHTLRAALQETMVWYADQLNLSYTPSLQE